MNIRNLTLLILIIFSRNVDAQKIQFIKENKGFLFIENNKEIFFFHRCPNDSLSNQSHCNYFHPVFDLKGNCISEDFIQNKNNHGGIFWAWQQIHINDQHYADGWNIQNFTQAIEELEFKNESNGNGILSYTSYWQNYNTPNDPFIQEKTQVCIYPKQPNYRRIDFIINLKALEQGLKLGGIDNDKGIGGFSIHLKTDENTVFTDIENNTIILTEHAIDSGRIIDITNKKQKNGVSIIIWKQNPGKTKWILYKENSLQNASWPGCTPINLSVNEPLTLKYTLIIHKGKRNAIPFKYLLKETSK